MKRLTTLLVLGLVFLISSCTKVIDLPLKKTDQRIVIEGFVTKGLTTHQIKITKTLDFDVSDVFPTVDNAIVTISDDQGNDGTFVSLGNGIYEIQNFLGQENHTYTLKVEIDGINYEATSTMPDEVILEDIDIVSIPFGGQSFLLAVPKRVDIAGKENFYHYQCYVNDTLDNSIQLQTDENQDGLMNEQPIFVGISSNDQLRIVMHCIDKKTYRYLFSISANTGSIASPANPESNFGNGALGYFAARCTSEKTITVP